MTTWWCSSSSGGGFKHAGAKETEISERFGMTATVNHLRLNALIDRPEALAADPMTVRRLLQPRSERARLG